MADTPAPATDEQIDAIRSRLELAQIYEVPPWSNDMVAILLRRIDTDAARVKQERYEAGVGVRVLVAERDAARARVAKLEAALRGVLDMYEGCYRSQVTVDMARTALAAGLNPGPDAL